MRASRAGRTGGSWYGSYTVVTDRVRFDATNKERAIRSCRKLVKDGDARWAELRTDKGDVLYRVGEEV